MVSQTPDPLERQQVDARFAAMAEDTDYQLLNQELVGDFADSDWEALLLEEEERGDVL